LYNTSSSDCTAHNIFILLLAGANDLGAGAEADKLLAALSQMHNTARATGARTAALSIPQYGLELVNIVLACMVWVGRYCGYHDWIFTDAWV